MRILVISDIHANAAALEAVLSQADPHDAVWCLGDLVGYGPDPNECVARVRALPHLTCLAGNHDKAVLGEIDPDTFNDDARSVILWTRNALSADHLEYLRGLPVELTDEDFTLVHGSPRQPVWEYILNRTIACDNFPYVETPYCLIGHSHIAGGFGEGLPCFDVPPDYANPLALGAQRLILNPGSVGQPRDQNPLPAFAILDTEARTWQYRRASYDPRVTQRRMLDLNFPERLVLRLAYGW